MCIVWYYESMWSYVYERYVGEDGFSGGLSTKKCSLLGKIATTATKKNKIK